MATIDEVQTENVLTPAHPEGIGAAVPRVEDARFLTGLGQYLADVRLPEMKHLAILRSPIAHATVRNVDLSEARAAPGVVAAFTGEDLARVSRSLSHLLPMPTIKPLEWHVLATDKVRFVGEPVAVVIAENRYLAEDAMELITVDYEDLPAVADIEEARGADAPLLYEEWGSNEFLTASYATGDLDGAFEAAAGVLRERFAHHRVIGLPLEGHGACGSLDPSTGRLLLYASNQQPHNLRTLISDVTGLSEAKIRVVAPDMGGGFGNKQHFVREEALVAVVATQVPYPVMWVQDRTESLTASVHSREQIHEVEAAYGSDGRILALRAKILADVGNPVLYFTGAAPSLVTASMLTGTYQIPNFTYELHCIATNRCPVGAYRGFGQPQALFTIERVIDLVAEQVGRDPLDVRRLNMIPDEPRPWTSPTGARYDTGSFHQLLEQVDEAIDYQRFRREQAESRAEGRYVGIGFSSVVEPTAPNLHVAAGRYGGFEMALVAVQPDGHVNVQVGTKSQGQGHETTIAQVASDVFTLPINHIDVHQGDTAAVPYGMGTWGSRSAVMGGGAVLKAAVQIREKMVQIAAHMLETPADGVALEGGMFQADKRELLFAQVAEAAYLHTFLLPPGMDMGLVAVASHDSDTTSPFPDEEGRLNVAGTYASAAAAATVEVDPTTGQACVLDCVIAHDCGRIINPMIVDGQLQGAFAQAMGALFLEEIVYDEDGQPLTTTLLDYLTPSFGSVPQARFLHRETASSMLGGFRGAGEAGIIATPAALANAVHDALAPLGVRVTQTNLSARRIRALLRKAGVSNDPLQGLRFAGLQLLA